MPAAVLRKGLSIQQRPHFVDSFYVTSVGRSKPYPPPKPKPHLGFCANLAGKGARQEGHVFLLCWVHLLKQPRQKLCWHGA